MSSSCPSCATCCKTALREEKDFDALEKTPAHGTCSSTPSRPCTASCCCGCKCSAATSPGPWCKPGPSTAAAAPRGPGDGPGRYCPAQQRLRKRHCRLRVRGPGVPRQAPTATWPASACCRPARRRCATPIPVDVAKVRSPGDRVRAAADRAGPHARNGARAAQSGQPLRLSAR